MKNSGPVEQNPVLGGLELGAFFGVVGVDRDVGAKTLTASTGPRARHQGPAQEVQGPPTAVAVFTRNNNNQIQPRKSRQASTRG
jgi:hypothetical protein